MEETIAARYERAAARYRELIDAQLLEDDPEANPPELIEARRELQAALVELRKRDET